MYTIYASVLHTLSCLVCQGSGVSIRSTVLDNNYIQGFLLGQPLKRSVHILYRLLAHMLSVGSLVLQSEDALQVIVCVFCFECVRLCIVVLVQAVLKLLRVVVVVVK